MWHQPNNKIYDAGAFESFQKSFLALDTFKLITKNLERLWLNESDTVACKKSEYKKNDTQHEYKISKH